MDKTPWIPSKKSTKADLKRILQIVGVVPPKEYDAKELRELVTETHTEFMSLVAEGTSGAATVLPRSSRRVQVPAAPLPVALL